MAAEQSRDGREELVQGVAGAAGDVDVGAILGPALARLEVRVHDVVDEGEVARLLPVAVNRRRSVGEEPGHEDRDHRRVVGGGVLLWPEDVEIAQRHRVEPIERAEHAAVVLPHPLLHGIRRQRRCRHVLALGELVRVSVGGRGGGVHDALGARVPRRDENVQRAADVDLVRGERVVHTPLHRGERRLMEHEISALGGPADRRQVGDAALHHLDAIAHALQVLALAGREVVEHDDRVAAPHQGLDEVRADEPRAARDQDLHLASLPCKADALRGARSCPTSAP